MALRALQGPTGGGAPVGGGGTSSPSTIPRWTGPSTLGDSGLIDNGTAIYTTARDVGIGTASPGAKLDVSDTANQLRATVSNATPAVTTYALGLREGYISARQENSGSFNVFTDIVSSTSQFTPSGLRFFTHASGDASISERARIDSNGNLVVGLGASASTSTNRLQLANNSTAKQGIEFRPGVAIGGGTGNEIVNYDRNLSTYLGTEWSSSFFRLSLSGSYFEASTSGAGLKLPATPGNADTQTLDAYQEGTVTATITTTTGTVTLVASLNTLRYTRIGRMVHVQGYLEVQSVTGPPTGDFVVNGLPATIGTGTQSIATGAVWTNGMAAGYTGTAVAVALTGTTTLSIRRITTAGVNATDFGAYTQAGTAIAISIWYSV